MIYLVVGQPRNGKSQFVVSKILEMIAENDKLEQKGLERRKIYCDIAGLKIPEVEPAPDDWRLTPNKSIIIYDEVHFRKAYEYKGNQYSQDPMITELTVHGHYEKDIWLITQDPARLEKGIHKLVEKMFFIKRPASLPKYTNVFEFDKWLSNPEPAANRNAKHKKYLDYYRFNFKDEYQDLYESASGHENIKFKLPRQLFVFLGIVVAVLIFAGAALMNTDAFNTKRFEEKNSVEANKNATGEPDQDSKKATEQANAIFNPVDECRKGENVSKPECVKWFDELSKSGASVSPTGEVKVVSYDSSKPYDFKPEPNIQVQDYPRLTGCARDPSGRYRGIDQQGNIMPEIKQSDCKRWMNGERLFDYTRPPVQVNNNVAVPTEIDNQKLGEPSIQQAAKMEQAKMEGLI